MSDEYRGPERRRYEIDPDTAAKIARIDERTKMLVDNMGKLATVESVTAVDRRLSTHLDSHVTRGSLVAVWVGMAVTTLIGLGSLIASIAPKIPKGP